MPQRNDIHRTSQVDPLAYDFVAFGYQKIDFFGSFVPAVINAERERLAAHMAKTGGSWSQHEHGGSCHICGASAIYTVIFWHRATNVYIRTGNDCAAKMDMSYGDFNAFQAGVHDARERHAGRAKAQVTLADAGLTAAWELYTQDPATLPTPLPYEERTVIDIVGKLVRYGNSTDRALDYARTLLARIPQRQAIADKRAAEAAAAPAVVSGRQTIAGEILKAEWRDSRFGRTLKITVKTSDNRVYWGTCPSGLGSVNRGDRVEFSATVETTDRANFGFFT